jgi:LysM repeat protein
MMRRIGQIGILFGLAVLLSGCFQSAGSAVEPTIANATATSFIPPAPTFPTQPPQPTIEPSPTIILENTLPPLVETMETLTPPSETPFMTPIGPDGFQTPIPTMEPFPPTETPAAPEATPDIAPTQPVDPNQPTPAGTTIVDATPTPESPDALAATIDPSLFTPTPLPTDPPCEYTVQRNDTFYAIARKLQIAPTDLIAANPRTNPDALQIGEKLIIPNCTPSATTGTPGAAITPNTTATINPATIIPGVGTPLPAGIQAVYLIQQGDTLGRIAQRYGVTVQDIVRANGFANENVILNVDQKILIPARTP